jgi:hypothetical protein
MLPLKATDSQEAAPRLDQYFSLGKAITDGTDNYVSSYQYVDDGSGCADDSSDGEEIQCTNLAFLSIRAEDAPAAERELESFFLPHSEAEHSNTLPQRKDSSLLGPEVIVSEAGEGISQHADDAFESYVGYSWHIKSPESSDSTTKSLETAATGRHTDTLDTNSARKIAGRCNVPPTFVERAITGTVHTNAHQSAPIAELVLKGEHQPTRK